MNGGLFISLYLDEDISVLIADVLTERGFQVQTARDAGMLRKSDPSHLAYAAMHGLAIATHNRGDFQTLHRRYIAAGRDHAGILLVIRRSPYDIADRLEKVLNAVAADEMRNQLLFV